MFEAKRAAATRTSASSEPVHTSALTEAESERLDPRTAALVKRYPAQYQKGIVRALDDAGKNRSAIYRALKHATASEREAMGFLVANMPVVDAGCIRAKLQKLRNYVA